MKKLNFEQMENIQGGVNCFFVGAGLVGAVASMAMGNIGPILDPYFRESLSYCWNS